MCIGAPLTTFPRLFLKRIGKHALASYDDWEGKKNKEGIPLVKWTSLSKPKIQVDGTLNISTCLKNLLTQKTFGDELTIKFYGKKWF